MSRKPLVNFRVSAKNKDALKEYDKEAAAARASIEKDIKERGAVKQSHIHLEQYAFPKDNDSTGSQMDLFGSPNNLTQLMAYSMDNSDEFRQIVLEAVCATVLQKYAAKKGLLATSPVIHVIREKLMAILELDIAFMQQEEERTGGMPDIGDLLSKDRKRHES